MFDWISIVGYTAALLVATTFYMKTMIALRCFAIASNLCFIIYAYFHLPILYPILLLHVFLFPLNLHRLLGLLKNDSIKKNKTHVSFNLKQ
jgi:hypothetical protein